MTPSVDILPLFCDARTISLPESSPNVSTFDDETVWFDCSSDPAESSKIAHSHGRSRLERPHRCCLGTSVDEPSKNSSSVFLVPNGNLIVAYLGQSSSTLRAILPECFRQQHLTLVCFSRVERIQQWLISTTSVAFVFLVLQSSYVKQSTMARLNNHRSVHSILVRCSTSELTACERLTRSHCKVNGVFDDDTRILVQLVFSLILFSEEQGDRQKYDCNNQLTADTHYDRAIQLSQLVDRL
jgi:hypothetical protein